VNTIEVEDRLAQKYPQAIHPARGSGLLCAGELNLDNLVTKLTQSCLERDLLITLSGESSGSNNSASISE
jgi:acetylornithine/succinyldiaminopimelate/putrescine aminotransferase